MTTVFIIIGIIFLLVTIWCIRFYIIVKASGKVLDLLSEAVPDEYINYEFNRIVDALESNVKLDEPYEFVQVDVHSVTAHNSDFLKKLDDYLGDNNYQVELKDSEFAAYTIFIISYKEDLKDETKLD